MFTPLLARVEEFLQNVESSSNLTCTDVRSFIDHIYVEIAQVLLNGANIYVPTHRKNFFKFWWNEELELLKKDTVESNSVFGFC